MKKDEKKAMQKICVGVRARNEIQAGDKWYEVELKCGQWKVTHGSAWSLRKRACAFAGYHAVDFELPRC